MKCAVAIPGVSPAIGEFGRRARLGWRAGVVALAWAIQAQAGNPIVPGVGLTDPHVVIHGDRAYAYAGHDQSAAAKSFVMSEWWIWSSADLVHWRKDGVLKPEDTFLKRPFTGCWAGFSVARNGRYYWYFSAGPTEIGVVTADTPVGPWTDPLGHPLIAKGFTPTEQRDPDIFIDDDGAAYMVYGTFKYFLVRLNEDMVSLAESPRRIQLDREFGPYGEGRTDDKPSLHKRGGIYYLSWSSFYATSRSIYGPYTFKGSVISPETTAPQFRMDDGRFGGLRHDRHGNFFTWHNQWFYIFNDKSQPGRSTWFRDACIAYVHYRDNGEIAPVRLDAIGVGEYDAQAGRIEAEDYFAAEGCEVRERAGGGFEVRGLGRRGYLRFPQVRNLPRNGAVTLQAARDGVGACTLEIRRDRPDGPILGAVAVPEREGDQTLTCEFASSVPTVDLCVTVTTKGDATVRLDAFAFRPAGRTRE